MRRRAPHIQPRRRVFLGGEGHGEAGYGTLIGRLARDMPGAHVHVDVHVLQPGAGSPLALAERAAQIIRENERRRAAYAIKAVMLDSGEEKLIAEAIAHARQIGIDHLIWQSPDHEALLLRHLPNCQQRSPPHGASLEALLREWPQYRKPMAAQELAQRIALEQIKAACGVETELYAFLRAIGLF